MGKSQSDHPLPSHIAWRVAPHTQALLRAVRDVLRQPGLTDRHARNNAVRALLDAEARSQGCLRAGEPRRWMTREEYEAYRRETPGYRLDPEAHARAAAKIPARVRKARAVAGGRAGAGRPRPR